MNWVFLLVILIEITVYDFWRYLTGGVHSTISWSIYELCQKHLAAVIVISVSTGILLWHLIGGVCD
jgi:hypothetical protein